MVNIIRNGLFLALIFFLCSCQKNNEIVVRKVNGVTFIQNPETPVQTTLEVLQFKEVFRLGEHTDKEHEIFHWITDLYVDEYRNLYVAEQGNRRVQKFDSTGQFLKILGRAGQGPGEYVFPALIFENPYHQIIILDNRLGKFIYFNQKGNHIKDDRLRDEIKGDIYSPYFIDKMEIVFLSPEGRDIENHIAVNRLYSFDLDTRTLKELFGFNIPLEVITGNQGVVISKSKWEYNITLSPQNKIFIAKSPDYKIDVYNLYGSKIKEIIRTYKKIPLSKKEKENLKSGPSIDGKTLSPPDYHSDIQALCFVVPGECWVITSCKEKNKRIIDVLDAQGKFVGQLSLNIPIFLQRSYRNLTIQFFYDASSSTVFLYQVEEHEGIEHVACYKASY